MRSYFKNKFSFKGKFVVVIKILGETRKTLLK